jgi:hypothetical protein
MASVVWKLSSVILLAVIALSAKGANAEITNLRELQIALQDRGGGRLGFISEGDWGAVAHQFTASTGLNGSFVGDIGDPSSSTPTGVEVVQGSAEELKRWVKEDLILAGVTNGGVDDSELNQFSSMALTTRAMLLKDGPVVTESGNYSNTGLLRALDAAIVDFIADGGYSKLEADFEGGISGKQVQTCAPQADLYQYPSYADLDSSDVLKQVIDNGSLPVAQLGFLNESGVVEPYGFDDLGEYPKDKSTFVAGGDGFSGWFPRLEVALLERIADEYKEVGSIEENPQYYANSQEVLEAVQNGTAFASAPYYSLAGTYMENNVSEPRREVFKETCVLHAFEPFIFTKAESESSGKSYTTRTLATLIAVPIAGLFLLIFAIILVHRERAGSPLFLPLNEQENSSREMQ